MVFITLYKGSIMNGSKIWVMAIMVPVLLCMISSRLALSTSPRLTKISLTTPFSCNSTIHEEVRTKSEVQNGNKTKIISRLDMRNGMLDSKKATGYPIRIVVKVMMTDRMRVRINKRT